MLDPVAGIPIYAALLYNHSSACIYLSLVFSADDGEVIPTQWQVDSVV